MVYITRFYHRKSKAYLQTDEFCFKFVQNSNLSLGFSRLASLLNFNEAPLNETPSNQRLFAIIPPKISTRPINTGPDKREIVRGFVWNSFDTKKCYFERILNRTL